MVIPTYSNNNYLNNTPHNTAYNNFNQPPSHNIELLDDDYNLNDRVRMIELSDYDIDDNDL